MTRIARLAAFVALAAVPLRADVDLAIAVTPATFTVETGARYAFDVVVHHRRGEPAAGRVVLGYQRLVAASGDGWTCSGGDCRFGPLASGATAPLRVEAIAPTVIRIRPLEEYPVSVWPLDDVREMSVGDNTVRLRLNLVASTRVLDIGVADAGSPRTTHPGGDARGLLDIRNRGTSDSEAVTVRLAAPNAAGPMRIDASSSDAGWTCSPATRSALCTRSGLAAGAISRLAVLIPTSTRDAPVTVSVATWAEGPHLELSEADNTTYLYLAAVTAESFTPILIPLYVRDAPGAFDSVWRSELRLHADTTAYDVVLFPRAFYCAITCGPDPLLGYPLTPNWPELAAPAGDAPRGAILYARRSDAKSIQMNLSIRDVSRDPSRENTQVPVAREEDLQTGRVLFGFIRVNPGARYTLRVYDVDARESAAIRVRMFDLRNPNAVELVLPLTVVEQRKADPVVDLPARPGYADIGDITTQFPQFMTARDFYIILEPLTPGLRYWAFLSIVDNETQQLSIMSPQ